MPLALLAAIALAAPPGDGWRFVDETHFAGRAMITFQSVDLTDHALGTFAAGDRPPVGAQYGIIALGAGGKQRLNLVWHSASGALWLDVNVDGRFAQDERHTLKTEPLEVRVRIPFDGVGRERTLLLRRRGSGLAYAVRGYTAGSLVLDGKPVPAMLVDGNADGCFDGAGSDRLWLDLNGDGRFDPFTEQFPLGNALKLGGDIVLIQPSADGLAVRVRRRPKETGELVVHIDRLPGTEVVELAAHYVSEFSELLVVRKAGEAVSVPAGKYRLDSLAVKVADLDGQVWSYSFGAGARKFDTVVSEKRQTASNPLAGLKIDCEIHPGSQPDEPIAIYPNVFAGELYLMGCESGPRDVERGKEMTAEITVFESTAGVVEHLSSGFM